MNHLIFGPKKYQFFFNFFNDTSSFHLNDNFFRNYEKNHFSSFLDSELLSRVPCLSFSVRCFHNSIVRGATFLKFLIYPKELLVASIMARKKMSKTHMCVFTRNIISRGSDCTWLRLCSTCARCNRLAASQHFFAPCPFCDCRTSFGMFNVRCKSSSQFSIATL